MLTKSHYYKVFSRSNSTKTNKDSLLSLLNQITDQNYSCFKEIQMVTIPCQNEQFD